MKTIKSILILTFVALGIVVLSQNSFLPEVDIYTLDGTMVRASEISNDGKPMIMVFWKTFDKDGCNQFMMLNDVYEEHLKEKGVKLIAICVDCKGRIDHVKPFIYGQDIEVEVFIDRNGDLKRAMNVSYTPYTLFFDQQMNVYCQYPGFCAGGEEIICDKIEQCLEKINNYSLYY